MTVLDEEPFVETFEDEIEAADHFCREVNELVVQLTVMFLQVGAHHFETVLFHQFNLIQLITIDLLADSRVFAQLHHLEIHDEVFEGCDHVLRVNVGSIDHSYIV